MSKRTLEERVRKRLLKKDPKGSPFTHSIRSREDHIRAELDRLARQIRKMKIIPGDPAIPREHFIQNQAHNAAIDEVLQEIQSAKR